MSSIEPSPQTTLVIFLGASEWPLSSLRSSPAFRESANKIRDYFCHSRLFGLPPKNWLDLFNKRQSNPDEVDQAIGNFLDQRILELKQAGTPARDVLFYYIGHGVFASDSERQFHLAIQSTRDDNIGVSAITMAHLAHTLKTKARHLRRIVILDCCFAAESLKYMQSAAYQAALQQTESAFEGKSIGRGFPKKGTALLCSSGSKVTSLILRDESGTMFSEALIRALVQGNARQLEKTYLTLYELKDLIEEILANLLEEGAPRPFVGSPDQSDGDVSSVPFFPNAPLMKRLYSLDRPLPISYRFRNLADDHIFSPEEPRWKDELEQLSLPKYLPGTTHEEQSLQLYQEALCNIFNFSSDDLAHNQRGQISDRQGQRLRKKATVSFWVFVFFLLLFSGLIFFAAPSWIGGILVIDILLLLLGIFWLINTRAYDLNLHRMQVVPEEGKINEREEYVATGGDSGGFVYHYNVNDIILPVPHRISPAQFLPIHHRVFYLLGNDNHKEFMSIEPCEVPGVDYIG